MMKATNLESLGSVQHGFFTRQGGYSSGVYDSLNCGLGSDDDQETVFKNKAACATALGVGADRLLTVHQEHTADVITVSKAWTHGNAPVADGLVTKVPGIAIAVLAADCTPVLFAAPEAGIIGAAHAGWKGAISGIVENTVDAMTQLGAKRDQIIAAVGPCIGPNSYEVGPEFHDRFLSDNAHNALYFQPSEKTGHVYFDIGGFVLDKVRASGVNTAERLKADTYSQTDKFFSYRRSCHRDETDYGRQLSGIALAP